MEQNLWFHLTNKDRALSGTYITCHRTYLCRADLEHRYLQLLRPFHYIPKPKQISTTEFVSSKT